MEMPGYYRRIAPGFEHSVAWLVWHMARCEDVTMNLLVARDPQVLLKDAWLVKLGIKACDTDNAMGRAEKEHFNRVVDIPSLRAYRVAVGRQTRRVVQALQPADLKMKVQPARLYSVIEQGAVVEAARGILDYWGRRDIAGLLLMPVTRHNLVHMNEAWQIKRRRG
jgi:hypothetical protein